MRVHAAGRITVGSLALLTFGCTANWGGAPEAPAIEITARPLTGPQATFPNVPFAPEEVGKPVAIIRSASASGAARGHSNVAVINGHLLVPFAPDSGLPGGGLSFYDLSDPRRPVLVRSVDEPALREAHGFGFSTSYGGNHAVFQTTDGIQFWDLSDVSDPRMIKHLVLPGILASDYAAGAWWAFWQAPYVYLGGSGNGLYVVDASDLLDPKLVTVVPTGRTGGFRIGPVYAFGNLLAISSADLPGYALLDISDPRQPALSAALPAGPPIYSMQLNGNRIYGAGLDGRLHIHDVSDPSRIVPVAQSPLGPGRGGYLSVQDGFVHGGFSEGYAKFDVSVMPPQLVLTGTSGIPTRDEDFGMVLGNLVFVGDDHGVGTALLPHQTAPDTTPPAVNAVNPADGASRQRLTSRVGLSFSDQIDLGSVNAGTIQVRPLGGDPLPGKYSTQTNLANFTPDAPLLPDTTYEVVVPAGGVRDYAGNPISGEFRARFATGSFVAGVGLRCLVSPVAPVEVRSRARIAVELSAPAGVSLSFDFGDGRTRVLGPGETSVEHRFREPGHYNVIVTASNGAETTTCGRIVTAHAPLTARAPTSATTILHDGVAQSGLGGEPGQRLGQRPRPHHHAPQVGGARGRQPAHPGPGQRRQRVGRQPGQRHRQRDRWRHRHGQRDHSPGRRHHALRHHLRSRRRHRLRHPAGHRAAGAAGPGQPHAAGGDPARGPGARGRRRRQRAPGAGDPFHLAGQRRRGVQAARARAAPGGDHHPGHRSRPRHRGDAGAGYPTTSARSPSARTAIAPLSLRRRTTSSAAWRATASGPPSIRWCARWSRRSICASCAKICRARRDLNDKDMAQAVAFSRYGDYAAVALQGSNEVQILDAYTGALVGGISGTGLAPQGLAFSADYRTLFVNNFLSRTVSAHDVSGLLDSSDTTARPIGGHRHRRRRAFALPHPAGQADLLQRHRSAHEP